MNFYRIICLLFSLVSCGVFSQNRTVVDSLENLLLIENDLKKRGDLFLELAQIYEYGDYLKSYDYVLKVRDIANKLEDLKMRSDANLFLSNVLIRQGKYNEGLQYLNQELKGMDPEKEGYRYVGLIINIGAVYYQIHNYEKALSYFLKAKEKLELKLVDENDALYPQVFIGTHNNIANVYDELNDNPKALLFYRMALEMARAHSLYENIGVTCKNMGDLYIEMNRFEEALPLIQESIQVREKINDLSGLATSYFVLGYYHLKREASQLALMAYEKSLEYGIKANAWLTISETSHALFQFHKDLDDYKKSLSYFHMYHQYQDSLRTQNSEKRIMATEFDYQMKKRQEEWNEQQKKERQVYYIIGVAMLILASYLLLLFFLSRARVKRGLLEKKNLVLEKESLEFDLNLKKKELTTNVMYLVRKNELIREVSNRLMDSIGNLKLENQKIIQNIMFDLQQGLDNDIWNEFEIRFNQVHSDFYTNLREKCPQLTPNEVKLSAFLRLNMSSKEISAITHQSIRSIEVARTRLRKKLNLTNTEVGLITFLNEL